jgi:hypothetical protein
VALAGLGAVSCGRADVAAARDLGGDDAAVPHLGGGSGDDAAPPEPPPPAHVAGRWGMRGETSDSVAADLAQVGGVVTGTLCFGGLPVDDAPFAGLYCAPVTGGRVDGRRLQFGAKFQGFTFAVDAFVSGDGKRIGGVYSWNDRRDLTAWWPLADGSTWVDPEQNWPSDLRPWSCGNPASSPGYELTLVDDSSGAGAYAADRTYLMVFCAGIAGELGAFGGDELQVTSVDGHTTTIVAGPVPETAPGLPTGLTLHFETSILASVEARMPSGATYSFSAVRSPGGSL